ncbi:MAG: hypothetical protein SNH79_06610 [Rikenellaceae bacterium]
MAALFSASIRHTPNSKSKYEESIRMSGFSVLFSTYAENPTSLPHYAST